MFEHNSGFVVLLAGDYVLPVKPSSIRRWVASMAEAWQELVADHISMLNSTGEVASPNPMSRMEYLAKRFEFDETNLWLLAEESGEVVRSCGKLGRWGYDHVHQVTGESGMRLLEAEVGDFLAIVDIMVARGHFTEDALEAAKQAKLKRLEDWYEAPWAPDDLTSVQLIPGGLPDPPLGFQYQPMPIEPLSPPSPPTRPNRPANAAYYKERAERFAKAMFPFKDLPAESSGLASGIAQSYSHVSSPEPTEAWSPVEELPRTPEGYLDWKALDGDLATVKQGVGGLLTVEVTKNGRMRVFTGIVASPVTISINPTH